MAGQSAVGVLPKSPGFRPCCILAPKVIIRDNIFDYGTDPLGHRYGGGDKVGIAYSCKAGFVDLGHLRDLVDLTKFYYDTLKAGKTELKPFKYDGKIFVTGTIPDEDAYIAVAQSMAFDESVFHEIETYFIGGPGSHNSSFSPEDLPSNYLGTVVAARAIKAGGDFDDAATKALTDVMSEVAAQDKNSALDAFDHVKGIWIDASGPFGMYPPWAPASLRYLKRRNFTPLPWIVDDIVGCIGGSSTWPSTIPQSLTGDPGQYYTGTFVVEKELARPDDRRQEKLGTKLAISDFLTAIATVKQDAQQQYGSKYDKPDP